MALESLSLAHSIKRSRMTFKYVLLSKATSLSVKLKTASG